MAVGQQELMTMLNELREDFKQLRADLSALRETLAKLPLREEIITRDVYMADKRGLDERVRRLEANPQKQLGYLGAGVGCASLLVSGVMLLFYVGTYFLTHYKP